MKPVKNVFLVLFLVFAAKASFAQEVKPEKYKSAANKETTKRVENHQARKHKKIKSDVQKMVVKPMLNKEN